MLREAGLVVGERHRHEVRYRRTDIGTALTRRGELLPARDSEAAFRLTVSD